MRLVDSTLVESDVPRPQPGRGELLIRVYAAGVTTSELLWLPTLHSKTGEKRVGAVPGHEFSGVIAGTGEGVNALAIGQEVFGMNDWFADGAMAEYCITQPSSVTSKPPRLTHAEAASIPIGALTAWQGLFDRANLQPGERVLVHGGAGAVGVFAIQLAIFRGARVIATASARNLAFVASLGAEEVIDHRTSRFEDSVQEMDVVFDTKEAYFIVEPNQKQLAEIGAMIEEGRLHTFVDAVVPLSQASDAYAGRIERRGRGKVVVAVAD